MAVQTDDLSSAPAPRRMVSAAPASPNEEAIERALREAGVGSARIASIEPSLEDVFISLMKRV